MGGGGHAFGAMASEEIVAEQRHRIATIRALLREGVGPHARRGLLQSIEDAERIIELQKELA